MVHYGFVHESSYKSHGLWSEVHTAFDSIRAIDQSGDVESIKALDGLRELAAISESSNGTNWTLTTDAMLSALQQSWAQVNAYLNLEATTPHQGYLANAVTWEDTIRTQLAALPRVLAHGTAQANLTRAFNRYRTELDASRDRIAERLETVLADAKKREEALAESIASLEKSVEFSGSLLATLEDRITQNETRLDTALTKNNETFIAAQTVRDKGFKDWLGEREKTFVELASPHLRAIEASSADASDHLAVITGLRTSTVEMSNLAAGDILADKYGEYATSERHASYVAYAAGIVAVLGSVFIILFAFGHIDQALTWQTVSLKFGLTAAAGGVAAVAFRFGGQAVRRATSFKRQELELRALQPFLKDVVGADLAKTAFLERAFGRAWEETAAKKSDGEVNDSMVKLVTTLVQNLPKSAL